MKKNSLDDFSIYTYYLSTCNKSSQREGDGGAGEGAGAGGAGGEGAGGAVKEGVNIRAALNSG